MSATRRDEHVTGDGRRRSVGSKLLSSLLCPALLTFHEKRLNYVHTQDFSRGLWEFKRMKNGDWKGVKRSQNSKVKGNDDDDLLMPRERASKRLFYFYF